MPTAGIRPVFFGAILAGMALGPALAVPAPDPATGDAAGAARSGPAGADAVARDLADLRRRSLAGQRMASELRGRLGRLTIAMQRLARQPPAAALTMPGSPLDAARAMMLVRHLIAAAKAEMDRVDAELADLERIRSAIEALPAPSAGRAPAEGGSRPAPDPPAADAGSRRIPDGGALVASADAAAAAVSGLQDSDDLAWPTLTGPGDAIAAFPSESAGGPGVARPARGALRFPAAGRITRRFGEVGVSSLHRKGVTVQTGVDAEVVAPYDGLVHFAGPFPGYGPILIIEHGQGLHLLLAGLGQLDVRTGQRIAAGETIGIMSVAGVSDSKESPRLYIELREDGKAVDPLTWLSVERGSAN